MPIKDRYEGFYQEVWPLKGTLSRRHRENAKRQEELGEGLVQKETERRERHKRYKREGATDESLYDLRFPGRQKVLGDEEQNLAEVRGTYKKKSKTPKEGAQFSGRSN